MRVFKIFEHGMVSREGGDVTGSGHRGGVFLICTLHLFLERREARSLYVTCTKKKGWSAIISIPLERYVWSRLRFYLDVFRFRCWEGLDKIFDLFGLDHEVVYEFLLVR
jgi:hypothetical protein